MQNEAEVVLVLFLVITFCEFGVKGAKTSVVVKKVVFSRLVFRIVMLKYTSAQKWMYTQYSFFSGNYL